MGLEPERARPELGVFGRGQAGAWPPCCAPQPPRSREPDVGSPRLGGLPLQFAASCRGFQLQGSPKAPQEITAPKCAPQEGGGGVLRLPPPISEGLGPPK